MKRCLIFLLLFCFFMTACSTTSPANEPAAEGSISASPTSNAGEIWGITLSAEDVTASGLTLRCIQSGGLPTGELSTGSYYTLDQFTDNSWTPVNLLPHEQEIAWTSEAWIIPTNGDVTWDVDWAWLYGSLPNGHYRIGKTIMDWRAPGEYDQQMLYAEFDIPAA